MILIKRHNTVLLWEGKTNKMVYCAFCKIKKELDIDISGNCPISYGYCICTVHEEQTVIFDSTKHYIFATIYRCNIKGTICIRDCTSCSVQKLIDFINKGTL